MTQTHINNRYILKGQLGIGGMGEVHLAIDRLSGDKVALKRVHLNRVDQLESEQHDFRLLLAHEFQTLSSLRHPNIISVLDYGFDREHQPFFTMTYLPEKKNILAAGDGLCLNDKADLIHQMLQALAYLHRRNILHQDIKPDNVLVHEGRLRLLDFGLAAVRSNQPISSSGGTLDYWSPELWLGEAYTEAADMFAAGVIAFELLTGRHPFAPVDSFLIDRVLEDEPGWPELKDTAKIFKPFLAKLLAKSPVGRFQRIDEAIQALNQITPDNPEEEPANIRESYLQAATFVGRLSELDRLKQALDKAKVGQGEVWLVGGESGVGKTRFLDEFRAHALVAGWQVISGQAIDGGGAPYQLWRDVIPHLLLSLEISDLEASILAQIAPTIGRIFNKNIPDPPNLDGRNMQKKIIETILAILQRQPQPTLLLLEDLHWSNESLYPINELLTAPSMIETLFIVGTYRNDERPNLPDILAGAKSMRLDRLKGDDVHHLSQAILGGQVSNTDIVSLLVKETEGNTFFIVEVLRALAEQVGRLDKVGNMLLPESVSTANMTQILRRRIEQVSAEDFQLLRLAAVAGRQIDQNLLQQLSIVNIDLNDWLQRVSDVAVFTVRNGQWQFSHDKLRETILSELDKNMRQHLHEQVALGLETAYAGNKAYATTLMNHWQEANNNNKELQYLVEVVKQDYLDASEFERARKQIERGLIIAQQGDPQRVTLQLLLSDTYFVQDHYVPAYQHAKEAKNLAIKLGDKDGLAESHLALGNIASNQAEFDTAEAHLLNSLRLYQFEENSKGISDVYHVLGTVVMHQGQYDQAIEYMNRSKSIRESIGHQRGVAYTLNNMGQVYFHRKEFKRAQKYYEDSLEIRYQLGDPYSITNCLINLSFAYLELNDARAAATLVETLANSLKLKTDILSSEALVGLASLELEQNNNVGRAAEIAGFITSNPINVDVGKRLDRLLAKLEAVFEPKTLQKHLEKGKTQQLDQLAEALIAQYS